MQKSLIRVASCAPVRFELAVLARGIAFFAFHPGSLEIAQWARVHTGIFFCRILLTLHRGRTILFILQLRKRAVHAKLQSSRAGQTIGGLILAH